MLSAASMSDRSAMVYKCSNISFAAAASGGWLCAYNASDTQARIRPGPDSSTERNIPKLARRWSSRPARPRTGASAGGTIVATQLSIAIGAMVSITRRSRSSRLSKA